MVLLCSKRGLGEATYKVKSKFGLGEMNVVEGDSIDDPTFFLRDDKWNIQLCTEYVFENHWLRQVNIEKKLLNQCKRINQKGVPAKIQCNVSGSF